MKKTLRNVFVWSTGFLCLFSLIPTSAQEECCRFESNKRAAWESVIPSPTPQPEESCRWFRELPGDITYMGFDRLIVGIHYGCYSQSGTLTHTQDFLLALNAHSGNTIRQISWKDVSIGRQGYESIQLFSVRDKYLLGRVGAMLQLLSPDLEEIHSRLMPVRERWPGKGRDDQWRAHISPSGTAALLSHFSGERGPVEDHWLALDSFEELAVGLSPPRFERYFGVADNEIYYNPEDVAEKLEAAIYAVSRAGNAGHLLCRCRAVPYEVLRNGQVVVSGGPSFSLVDSSGGITYRSQKYGDNLEDLHGFRTSSQTDRFAFAFGKGYIGLLKHGGWYQVVVFDANVQKDTFRVKMKTHPQREGPFDSWPALRMALSPDASELAVMYGLSLKVFSVDKRR